MLADLGVVATALGFYLAGGTAVALRLGHRRSEDFDFFTQRVIEPLDLAKDLQARGAPFRTGFVAPHTLWGTVARIKTSFIQFRYPALEPPTAWTRFGIHLASIDDLVTMKLSAIVKRGSKKDFVDLYAIGTWGPKVALDHMLELYQKRFKTADIQHVLYGLTYFVDAESERMPKMLRAVTWAKVKKTIAGWVADLG